MTKQPEWIPWPDDGKGSIRGPFPIGCIIECERLSSKMLRYRIFESREAYDSRDSMTEPTPFSSEELKSYFATIAEHRHLILGCVLAAAATAVLIGAAVLRWA